MANEAKIEPSLSDLLATLARDTGSLVRQEIKLASAEMSVKAKRAARNAAFVAVGGALALVGLLALVTAIIAALATAVPVWLSSLIVGAVILIAGYAFVHKGVTGLKQIGPIPEQTLATLNADVAWAKEQIR